uniref:Uncharacterized protein n=1 Tax=Arion vulgaris TaxID=1028688 RepID=A0A0B7AC20_9EUPU
MLSSKAYMQVTVNQRHSLHKNTNDIKDTRIKCGMSWIVQAERIVEQLTTVATLAKEEEWIKIDGESSYLTRFSFSEDPTEI